MRLFPKATALLCAAVFVIPVLIPDTATAGSVTGIVHRKRLNVRAKPTSKSRKLYTLHKGDKVSILGMNKTRKWYKVKFTKKGKLITGWAAKFGITIKKTGAKKSAKTYAVVHRARLNVRSKPTSKSKKLYTLHKGAKVRVLKKSGRWSKIRFKARGKKITGWANNFGLTFFKKTQKTHLAAKPTPVPTPTPLPTPVVIPAPTEPAPVPSYAAPEEETYPAETAPAPVETYVEPEQEETTAESRSYKEEETKIDVNTRGGLSFIFHKYKLTERTTGSTSTSSLSYNLPGIGINMGADAYFLSLPPGRSRVGLSFDYTFGFYKYDVNMYDTQSPPQKLSAQGGKQSKSATSHDIDIRLLYKFNITDKETPPSLVFSTGYKYYKLNADDLIADIGPLALVVDQKLSSVPIGFLFAYPAGNTTVTADFDIYLLQSYSEGPGNPTGTKSSENISFKFGIGLEYMLSNSLDFTFNTSWQRISSDFSGGGRRILTDFDTATAKTDRIVTAVGVKYKF